MKLLTSFFALIFTFNIMATTKKPTVIYGEDNRQDFYQIKNEVFKELSLSTAGMISASNIQSSSDGFIISAPTMAQRGMCLSERFSNQITAANCSGFLIEKDLIATAGHCVRSEADCKSYHWVFNYKQKEPAGGPIKVKSSDVYKCKKIIKSILNSADKNDYAIIQLEKETDKSPLKFRTEFTVSKGARVLVIGHPTGLPTKLADDAEVRSLADTHFVANLDTYGGNSGSAVFNAETGVVEGILVRGENDYVRSPSGCMISNVCRNDSCRGEDVTYSKFLSETLKLIKR